MLFVLNPKVKSLLTLNQIQDILENVKFKHEPSLKLCLKTKGNSHYIQLKDTDLPGEFNTGRKWYVTQYMCKSEIVSTAFKAYMAWVEHEARESFTYKDQSIYGPHYDVEALVALASKRESHEYRD